MTFPLPPHTLYLYIIIGLQTSKDYRKQKTIKLHIFLKNGTYINSIKPYGLWIIDYGAVLQVNRFGSVKKKL